MIPLLNNFDPYEDFYLINPQLKIIFSEEYKAKVPTSHMWALFLYAHPYSKFYEESPSTRRSLIYKDYLHEDPTFSFDKYDYLIEKIEERVLSKAQRSLMR